MDQIQSVQALTAEVNSIKKAPMASHHISTFYFFKSMNDVASVKTELEQSGKNFGIDGLMILATEGLNATVSHPEREILDSFIESLKEKYDLKDLLVKNSCADRPPFRRFKVKLRPEIVTLGRPDLSPKMDHRHLTPQEWNEVLKSETDFVMIDTRNWYESKIGTFKGALIPPIDRFTEFPDFVESRGIQKDQKLLIFCTGGIRCEKGLLELEQRGYTNVYQLGGGILKYLEESPNDQFEGECFVFDHRVAVDQDLKPSIRYKLCPHDGQPADQKITCHRCGTETLISSDSAVDPLKKNACSKHCAYRLSLNPQEKGPPQV